MTAEVEENKTSFSRKSFIERTLFFYFIPYTILSIFKSIALSTYIGSIVNLPGIVVMMIIGLLMFLLYTFQFIYTYKTMVAEDFLIRSKMQFFLLYLIFFIPGSFEAFICVFIFFKESRTFLQILMGFVIFLLFVVFYFFVLDNLSDPMTNKFINRDDNQIKMATDINEHSTKVTKKKNSLVGNEYVLKAPMFFLKNLPKGPRTNIQSVNVAPNALVSFRNSGHNTLDHDRIEGAYRLELLPIGSKLKVVDAFELASTGLLNISKTTYLIVEDEKHNQAEITELAFSLDVVREKGDNFDYRQPLMPYILKFNKENKLELALCDSLSRMANDEDSTTSSKYIEVRLLRFLSDFKLLEDVEISKIGYGIDQRKMYSCVKVHFKSLAPLFLYYYYGQDWRLFTEFVDGSGSIIKRIGEFQDFNYQKAKQFSKNDLENYKRYDGFKSIEEINQKNFILPVIESDHSDEATPMGDDAKETKTVDEMVKEASERARLIMIENQNDTTKTTEKE